MSKNTLLKRQVQSDKSIYDTMVSDENIYKAILSVDSYMFNKELLCDMDIKLLNALVDKFNYHILWGNNKKNFLQNKKYENKVKRILEKGGLIECIRTIIKEKIEKKSELFNIEVIFKLKDIGKEEDVECEKRQGEAYFYVDDSVIFTNRNLEGSLFKACIKELTDELRTLTRVTGGNTKNTQKDVRNFLKEIGCGQQEFNYEITVHENGKSHYQNIQNSKVGYKYLSHLSRLASMGSFDIFSTFDDYEEIQIKEKFEAIITSIEKELELCQNKIKENQEFNGRRDQRKHVCENCQEYCTVYNSYKEYESKLKRFRRFFKYRVLIIELQQSKENYDKMVGNIIGELSKENFKKNIDEELLEIKLSIITNFLLSNDNLDTESSKKLNEIRNKIKEIENKIILKLDINQSKCFYYGRVFDCKKKNKLEKVNKYDSINKIVAAKVSNVKKHKEYQCKELQELAVSIQKNIFV